MRHQPSSSKRGHSSTPLPCLPTMQTGPVLQAFYRFGPFDVDPAQPNQPPSPQKGSGSGDAPRLPPLILLPGLGATMIAWGVPLLRALACTHEVSWAAGRGCWLCLGVCLGGCMGLGGGGWELSEDHQI